MNSQVPDHEHGQSIRELLDSGLLEEKEVELRLALMDSPDDCQLLQKLAEIQRCMGDRIGSGKTYQRLWELRPKDAHLGRMATLLNGQSLNTIPAIPSKFHVLESFLSPQRVRDLLAHTRVKQDAFKTPRTSKSKKGSVHRQYYQSSICSELGSIQDWLDPLILNALPESLKTLDIEISNSKIVSSQLHADHEGHFAPVHQDSSPGVNSTPRLRFLYFFEFAPRRFRGGELLLYDRDADSLAPTPSFTTLIPEQNTLIFFPETTWQQVLPLRIETDDWFAARFRYSGWIHSAL